MIDPAQIPDEVVEAAAKAEYEYMETHESWHGSMRAAIAAALASWPGMTLHQQDINAEYSYFVLPLPTEKNDD